MTLEVDGRLCTSVSTDTRTLAPGALYVALKGPSHDGHHFIADAFARGALAAVVERRMEVAGAQIVVPDTLVWLQETARRKRSEWGGPVVGVTGSAGKTTTKDAIAAVLSAKLRVGKTTGNFNNHIGLPLSLLNMPGDADVAVIEIGMNHAGEIRDLACIAQPQYAVVTNVGAAHIENFDSVDGVALAKRELVEALPPGGVAFLNADDPRVSAFASVHPGRSVTYGLSAAAAVRVERVEYASDGARFVVDGTEYQTRLPARGGVMTCAAAIAVGLEFGLDAPAMRAAVAALAPPKMRLERLEHGGMIVWNDCYNSNPEAAMMMLDLLAGTPASRRIAVLGEMLELGRWSEALHGDVGIHAARCGINVLVGIRGAARCLVDAARGAGLEAGAALFFEQPVEAGQYVRSVARQGDALLFKGSRGTRVELALEEFLR